MPLQKQAFEPTVLINGAPDPTLRVVSVERAAGGQRLDNAVLELDLTSLAGDPLVNTSLGQQIQGQSIEVIVNTSRGPRVVHWGQVCQARVRLGDDIAVQLVSRLERQHFGDPIRGRWVSSKHPKSGNREERQIDADIVFNPLLDGVVIGNRSKFQGQAGGQHLFLDETIRTPAALTWAGENPNPANQLAWNLIEAVLYVCWAGNPIELYVFNPTRNQLKQVLDPSFTLLRDHRLPQGLFVPEALDKLLDPFGYSWCITHQGSGTRQITVFERGVGLRHTVGHQAPRQQLDLAETNLEDSDLQYDTTQQLVSRVEVLGGHHTVEVTVELKPGWDIAYDDVPWPKTPNNDTESRLVKDDSSWITTPAHADVGRKYVLNEAGDYINFRPSIKKPYDLEQFASAQPANQVTRRRKFLPCHTLQNGVPIGNVDGRDVELFDGTNWVPITKTQAASCHILEHECGIYFNDRTPPLFYKDAIGSTTPRLRVTACIELDERLSAVGEEVSAGGQFVPLLLDCKNRFRWNEIHSSSKYFNDVKNGTLQASETVRGGAGSAPDFDDVNIQDFADKLIAAWNIADCGGTVQVLGLDWTYDVGHVLASITGRNIDLSVDLGGKVFPTIVGVRWDVADMSVALTLETFRDERVLDSKT